MIDLAALGTFALVAACVLIPYFLFVVRPELASQEILRQRIRTGGPAPSLESVSLLREVEKLSVIAPLHRMLSGDNVIAVSLRDTVQLAGVKVTPGQVVLGSLALGAAVYLLVLTQFGSNTLAAIAGLTLTFVPYLVLRILRVQRLHKFEEQFPEAIDLIARTLRAGHAFTTGLRMAADELPQPVATEFRMLHDQQNFGLPLPDALRGLARRVPLIDARFFVTAVLTQREAGGNLAEVLDNLSAVIRERFKIKRQLRVITAHGRLTGLVLALLPPVLGAYLIARTPAHFGILITDPAGIRMVVIAAVLQLVGALMIYKITRVEY
ncbi:MAG: type II secretion system F family protein [Vicinamibacterales bacterium]